MTERKRKTVTLTGGPPDLDRSSADPGGPYVPAEFKRTGPPGNGDKHRPQAGKPPREGGAPPGMGGAPVGGSSAGMSIHKSEGLVPINGKCESNIPGLYAAGDALGYIEELRDHHMPMLRAADVHELRLAHETGNMINSQC